MADDPVALAMARLRMELARALGREQQIARLFEDAILQLRLAHALHRERLQAYVDGATLAALQVHSVQIHSLQHPAPPSGLDLWAEVLYTFLLDSTIAGKLLAKVTTSLLRSTLVRRGALLALPRSAKGEELVLRAKALAATKDKHFPRVEEDERGTGDRTFVVWPTIDAAQGVTLPFVSSARQASLVARALDAELDRAKLGELFTESVAQFVTGSSDAQKNVVAALKARKKRADLTKGRTDAPFAPADSPTAYILASVQQYGAVLRYRLDVEAAQVENLLRGRQIEPEALEPLLATWGLEELASGEGADVPADLEALRHRYALTFEAVIWAKLYGFDGEAAPRLEQNNAAIGGVPAPIVDYWRARLGPVTDEARRAQGTLRTRFAALGNASAEVVRLHEYLTSVGRQLARTAGQRP